MKVLRILCEFTLIILALISIFVCGLFLYYKFVNDDYTSSTVYVEDQIALDSIELLKSDELSDDEKIMLEDRYAFEVNLYSNSFNDGLKLFEWKFNYFTDVSLLSNTYRSTGIQTIIDDEYFVGVLPYVSSDGLNYVSVDSHGLDRETKFIIKIDEHPYQIQLTGDYYIHKQFLFFQWSEKRQYDWVDVFEELYVNVISSSLGYGNGYFKVDMSKYFTITKYDEVTQKFIKLDDTDLVNNYFILKFHSDEHGATKHNQSLFDQIFFLESFDFYIPENNLEVAVEWDYVENIQVLTNEDFEIRYSNVYDGNLLYLSNKFKDLFSTKFTRFNIVLHIDSLDNIIGIDYGGLSNLLIEDIKLLGNNSCFYVLNNAFENSSVSTISHYESVDIIYDVNIGCSNISEVLL